MKTFISEEGSDNNFEKGHVSTFPLQHFVNRAFKADDDLSKYTAAIRTDAADAVNVDLRSKVLRLNLGFLTGEYAEDMLSDYNRMLD